MYFIQIVLSNQGLDSRAVPENELFSSHAGDHYALRMNKQVHLRLWQSSQNLNRLR